MTRKTEWIRVLLIILAVIVILAPSYFRVFENFELATLDLRFKIRPPQPQNPDIAIIEIANDTLEKIGRWPLTRNLHAAIIEILSSYGAKSIVFDVIFAEPTRYDNLLVEATKKAGNVYYALSLGLVDKKHHGLIKADKMDAFPFKELKESCKGYGFINIIPDRDGKTRRVPLKVIHEGEIYPQLAFLVAADYLGKPFQEIEVPTDENSLAFINFAGRWKTTYKHYSFVDIIKSYSLLTEGQPGLIDLGSFRGKVCFIGLTATAAHDLTPVPFEKRYPGLGIHVNLFNSVVTDNFLRRASRLANVIILVFLGAITGAITLKTRPLISSIFIVSMIAVQCVLSGVIFVFANLWIDLFYPIISLLVIYLSLIFYKYIAERQKREVIEKELEVASKIQNSFLPKEAPNIKEVTVSADMLPAKQVGGDLYDFVDLGDGKIGVMVGDVSGKGVPAALYMARAVSLFRLFSKSNTNTKDTVTQLNDALSDESDANLFVTLTYMIYDSKEQVLTFTSGGHNPTLVLKKGAEKCLMLEAKEGMPLGLMPGDYSEENVKLAKGDIVVLYSDGVSEAMSKRREEFGEDRLQRVVEENRELDSKGLLIAIKDAVFKFAKSAPQHDDITIIVMEVK